MNRYFFYLHIIAFVSGTETIAQTCSAPYGTTYSTAQTFNGCGIFYPNCIEFNPVSISGNNIDIKCTSAGTTNEFIGGDYVRLTPQGNNEIRAQLISNTTDQIRFRAINSLLDIQYFDVPTSNTVQIFDKVEIGINFPNIDAQIAAFLNDATGQYKPSTTGYTNAFNNGTTINPYDPEHISVDAVFFRPSSPNQNGIIRYGFYYRTLEPYPSSGTQTDWQLTYPTSEPYEWRIRYAPDEVGEWTGYVNIYIGDVLVANSNTFSFDVVSGPNPGIVKIAPNRHYLYFSESDQSFIPVGDNYAWTQEQNPGSCGTMNCVNIDDKRMGPQTSEEFQTYIDELSNNGTNGGNTTRIIMVPWGLEIEREKLGNYHSRIVEMYELDNLVNYIENKGVYMNLCQAGIGFISGNGNFLDNWEGNPYNNNTDINDPTRDFKGISGVTATEDFFTNAEAIKFYKNKLRYIESRWGYSPHVYSFEPASEIDAISSTYWHASSTIDDNVATWTNDMGGYLKNISSHMLIQACFLPDAFGDWNSSRPGMHNLFQKPNIDIVGAHSYTPREIANHIDRQSIQDFMSFAFPLSNDDKPMHMTELEVYNYWNVHHCTDRARHDRMWASAFSGSMGPGSIWYERGYYKIANFNYGSGPYEGEYEKNYVALRTFLEQYDFKNYDFTSFSTNCKDNNCLASDKKFEIHYLKRSDYDLAIGWCHNRSFNFYINKTCNNINNVSPFPAYTTMADILVNESTLNPNPPCKSNEDDFQSAFNNCPGSQSSSESYLEYPQPPSTITLTGFQHGDYYDINWYWTWGASGGTMYTPASQSHVLCSGGNITITVPPTGVYTYNSTWPNFPTGTYPGDWAFEIIEENATRSQVKPNNQLIEPEYAVNVYPNPSNESFTFNAGFQKISGMTVKNSIGQTIKILNNINASSTSIDLSTEQKGIYFVQISLEGREKPIFKKIILQ
ncbi:MAG TPA: T9SS type A sorting domain-containing protein [Flavobacteriales bacterium]|nr:T9SS type A sorting domain-containing protein [Flavobacteriales bacterium]